MLDGINRSFDRNDEQADCWAVAMCTASGSLTTFSARMAAALSKIVRLTGIMVNRGLDSKKVR